MNNDKRKKLVTVTGTVIVLLSILLTASTGNYIIFLGGVGLFFLTTVAGIFIANDGNKANGAGKTSSESKKNTMKYEPLLLDEHTKQYPGVQRLLQYESVQKVFFSGHFPTASEELADPHLQELVSVLSQLADENGVIGL